jgi:hypothetical protein
LHLTAQPYLIAGSQFVAALAVVSVALTHDLTVARKMADGSFSLKVTVYLSGALVLAGSMMGRKQRRCAPLDRPHPRPWPGSATARGRHSADSGS